MAEALEADLSDELDLYLGSRPEQVVDVLAWWIERRDTYPCLSHMAINYLTIPGM